MATEITVLQPDPTVPLDRFAVWLADAGLSLTVIELWRQPVPALDELGYGVVILGGRDNCLTGYPWTAQLHELIAQIVDRDKPLLGICLGHQILADALGGEVTVGLEGEEGAFALQLTEAGINDPILGALPRNFVAAESHHDVVTTLPPDATLLASSERYANQSFRVRNAVGVQFHPEASPQLMGSWMKADGHDPAALIAEMEANDLEVTSAGQALAKAFAHQCIEAKMVYSAT